VRQQRPDLTGAALEKEIEKVEKAQEDKAKKLLEQARAGKDFAKLANENTDDIPMRAAKRGGDMGFMSLDDIKRSSILGFFAPALDSLKPNEIYPKLLRSDFGWHIVKLTADEQEGFYDFNEVKDQLKQELAAGNEQLAVNSWIAKKQNEIPIKISREFDRILDQIDPSKPTPMPPLASEPETTPAASAPAAAATAPAAATSPKATAATAPKSAPAAATAPDATAPAATPAKPATSTTSTSKSSSPN
jgi:hypothetical protein